MTRARAIFLALIALSWAGIVGQMIKEYRTVPSAEQLADARPVRPPLPNDLAKHIAMSSAEFVIAAILLWPWWRRWYSRRALAAALTLAVWFVFTAPPMTLNRMELAHRRWLALLVLALFAAAAGSGALAVLRAGRRRRSVT